MRVPRIIELRPVHLIAALLVIMCILLGVTVFRPPVAVANAADAPDDSIITVTGEGVIEAKPDTATVNLGVRREADTTQAAMDAQARAAQGVINALKNAGVKAEDIKTTQFSIEPIYAYPENKAPVLNSYRVTNMVTFSTRDLSAVGGLIDKAVAAGANDVNGVSFSIKDIDALKAQAIEAAVKDARAKADAAARAAGVKIRLVKTITIDGSFTSPVYNVDYRGKAMDSAASTPIESGTNTVRVSVNVVFGI